VVYAHALNPKAVCLYAYPVGVAVIYNEVKGLNVLFSYEVKGLLVVLVAARRQLNYVKGVICAWQRSCG
jgi:hypothetical protein